MVKEAQEKISTSNNKFWWKFMSFIRRWTTVLLVATMIGCSNSNTKIIKIWKWTNLTSIVKDSLWLSEDVTSDPELCKILIDNIAQQNNITDVNKISVNDTLTINMDALNTLISAYQTDTSSTLKQRNNKEKKEVVNKSYITIHSVDEFKNSKNYLVKKIYLDPNINWKFLQALEDWYTIHFLNSIETKNSPALLLDDITKPNEILGDELNGKTFILDPWHGSLDIWAIGLAQYLNEENKEKIAVYESAVMMDLTYRIARELRAHWANVKLTHYMNRRWIMDVKDLPPCSRVFDDEWKEVFQDIWDNIDVNSKWNLFNASGEYLSKRAHIANKYNPNLFVSLHADMLKNGDEIDDKSKILSIKYDERQANTESKNVAEKILNNGFGYYYNWKLAADVKRDVAKQHLWVLKPVNSPAILIEFWNISQESQTYILREPTKREELAKNFVSSLIKVYKK